MVVEKNLSFIVAIPKCDPKSSDEELNTNFLKFCFN